METGFYQYSELWGNEAQKGFDVVLTYYKLEEEGVKLIDEYAVPRTNSRTDTIL